MRPWIVWSDSSAYAGAYIVRAPDAADAVDRWVAGSSGLGRAVDQAGRRGLLVQAEPVGHAEPAQVFRVVSERRCRVEAIG